MRVPVQLMVAGKVVRITYPDTVPGYTDDGPDAYGDCDDEGRHIRISRTRHRTEREVFNTLFHELQHSSLTITGVCHMLGDKLEEAIVSGNENAISELFCFNPEAKIKWREIDFPQED